LSFTVSIQRQDFDLTQEVNALRAGDSGVGAVCCFVGTVREFEHHWEHKNNKDPQDESDPNASQKKEALDESISSLELEHYAGMTESSILKIMDQARSRFGINAARVVHRIGLLQPMDQIVLVAVTASHRGESFKACEYLMDYLKTQAPFWKKEQTIQGQARWVDARVSDDVAMAKWSN